MHWSVISLGGLLLGVLACAVGIALWLPWLTYAGLLALSFLAVVDAGLALRHAVRREWKATFVASVLCLLTLGVLERAVMRQSMASLFEDHDDFAEGLSIPEGLDLTIPDEGAPDTGPRVHDAWREAILSALETPATEERTVVASLPSLCALASNDRGTLMRHFAASDAWRVYVDRGYRVAVRMLAPHGRYEWSGDGYSDSELSPLGGRDERFSTRLVVHLGGTTDAAHRDDTTVTSSASPVSVRTVRSDDAFTSTLLVRCGALTTEVFERSSGLERRLTKAALRVLEAEMLAVRAGDAATPPVGSPSFDVVAGYQGGMYRYVALLNPGEPGTIHLRAYEVTRGTRLSAQEILRESSTHIGGSRDARETFPAQGEFIVGEGDWGQYYAARIEVWFRPDSGGRERKLIERLYRVEGWMR